MVHARLPPLVPVQEPTLDAISCLRYTLRRHMCCVRPVSRLRQAERHPEFALESQRYELALLLLAAEAHEHNDIGEVSDHRMFGL
jgi:hypothetical protein